MYLYWQLCLKYLRVFLASQIIDGPTDVSCSSINSSRIDRDNHKMSHPYVSLSFFFLVALGSLPSIHTWNCLINSQCVSLIRVPQTPTKIPFCNIRSGCWNTCKRVVVVVGRTNTFRSERLREYQLSSLRTMAECSLGPIFWVKCLFKCRQRNVTLMSQKSFWDFQSRTGRHGDKRTLWDGAHNFHVKSEAWHNLLLLITLDTLNGTERNLN